MDQPNFSDLEYQGKKRKTRRELFLERMDGLIPWQSRKDRIPPVYPKAGRGRHLYPLPVMLRVHCVQLLYNLSGPGADYHSGVRTRACQCVAGVEPAVKSKPISQRPRPLWWQSRGLWLGSCSLGLPGNLNSLG